MAFGRFSSLNSAMGWVWHRKTQGCGPVVPLVWMAIRILNDPQSTDNVR
jgi:hypothetical protein